jgi:hypothetical protein
MKLILKDTVKSPSVEIGIGMYSRKCLKIDPPFEVDREEGEALLRTGMFEEVEEPAQAEQSPTVTETSTEAEAPAPADATAESAAPVASATGAPDALAPASDAKNKSGKRGRK